MRSNDFLRPALVNNALKAPLLRLSALERVADPVEQATAVLSKYPLCDRCLGRLFAGLGRGLSNAERGRALKLSILMRIHAAALAGQAPVYAKEVLTNMGQTAEGLYEQLFGSRPERRACYICNDKLDEFLESTPEKVARAVREWGGTTFLVGASVDPEVVQREEKLKAEFKLALGESIKSEIKREVGKRAQALGLRVDFARPDVVVLVRFPSGDAEPQPRRLMISGVYRKLRRDLSLSPREPSLNPLTSRLLEMTQSSRVGIKGLVRDERGVRALGLGIPVTFLLGGSRVRSAPPEGTVIESEGASLEVKGDAAAAADEDLARRVRVYRCVIYAEGASPAEVKLAAESLKGREARQKVMGRTVSGVVREAACNIVGDLVECLISLDEKLYVMELVSGRGSEPSLSGLLGKEATCVEADLLGVIGLR